MNRQETQRHLKRLILPALLSSLLLASCATIDSDVYGEEDVLDYVRSVCTDEEFELVSSEQVEDRPKNVEYTFRSRERDLTFTANSYLDNVTIDGSSTIFYSKEISCTYVSEVHELYRDRAVRILEELPTYDDGWVGLLSFDDLDQVAEVMARAEEVYREELDYNGEDFLRGHPLLNVHLAWYPSQEDLEAHQSWINTADFGIIGLRSREELYQRLADKYAQMCVDSQLDELASIPEEYTQDKHVSRLDYIYLDGTKMTYNSQEDSVNQWSLITDRFCYCWYSQETGSYMLPCDIGYVTDSASVPLIVREYVSALGGSYSLEPEEGLSTWQIGDNTWQMESQFSDNEITEFQVTKNGEPLDLPFVTADEDTEVGARFCVGLKVEDFASLFDLDYRIDENTKRINFYS